MRQYPKTTGKLRVYLEVRWPSVPTHILHLYMNFLPACKGKDLQDIEENTSTIFFRVDCRHCNRCWFYCFYYCNLHTKTVRIQLTMFKDSKSIYFCWKFYLNWADIKQQSIKTTKILKTVTKWYYFWN